MNKCLFLLLLTGCTLQRPYSPPEMEVPCTWHSEIPETLSVDCSDLEGFQDPYLEELLELALDQNLDVQMAGIRVLKARAVANAKKGDLYPHVDASFTAGDIQSRTLQKLLECHARKNISFYELGFDAEWEIDFFGKTAYEICALKAEAEASYADLNAIWVTLSGEIAKNYIELRGLQAKEGIVEEQQAIQQQEVNLAEDLVLRGALNPQELSEKRTALGVLQAERLAIEQNEAVAIHRLSILVGLAPGELFECLAEREPLPMLPCNSPIGLPSELLQRRPDIQRAERRLAAATAQVGSAIASLFPRISLWGFIGDISTSFSHSSFTWALGPKILVPIFNSRLILQDVEYNKLSTQEALYHYQKTVLEALEEAENALFAFRTSSEQRQILEEAYAAALLQQQHEEEMHKRGMNSYFAVAAVTKNTLNKYQALLQAEVDQLIHYLAIYKALGGTWNTDN